MIKNCVIVSEKEVVKSPVCYPIYGGWEKVIEAGSIDTALGIVRNSTVLNVLGSKKIGIFDSSPAISGYADISEREVNVVSFGHDNGIVSTGVMLGMNDKFFFLKCENEFRKISKNCSCVFEV